VLADSADRLPDPTLTLGSISRDAGSTRRLNGMERAWRLPANVLTGAHMPTSRASSRVHYLPTTFSPPLSRSSNASAFTATEEYLPPELDAPPPTNVYALQPSPPPVCALEEGSVQGIFLTTSAFVPPAMPHYLVYSFL